MEKILLIIQREYLTRVKKKSFWVMTILGPILIGAMYGGAIFLAINGSESDKKQTVALCMPDSLHLSIPNDEKYFFVSTNISDAKKNIDSEYNYVLELKPSDDTYKANLYSSKQANMMVSSSIKSRVEEAIRIQNLSKMGLDTAKISAADANVDVHNIQITEKGDQEGSAGLNFGLGMAAAVILYVSILLYGVQTMRGVIEEKTNRIVEVLVSSVKPFELMMGKIIGIAGVGLTQFVLWISLSSVATGYVSSKMHFEGSQQMQQNGPGSKAIDMVQALASQNLWLLGLAFLFFFLFGYLLYAALFAAVGSAVDSETDSQQFTLPVTIPLIFAFICSTSGIIQNPDGALAFWLSIIPFTSPIAMMVRLPFGVPTWQLVLSMSLLLIGFVFVVWLAARIYRTGILLYGKKPSFTEMLKWAVRS